MDFEGPVFSIHLIHNYSTQQSFLFGVLFSAMFTIVLKMPKCEIILGMLFNFKCIQINQIQSEQ